MHVRFGSFGIFAVESFVIGSLVSIIVNPSFYGSLFVVVFGFVILIF